MPSAYLEIHGHSTLPLLVPEITPPKFPNRVLLGLEVRTAIVGS